MDATTGVDRELVDMMDAVFAAHREQSSPETAVAEWDTGLWSRLGELGLVRLTGSEDAGGSGAGWREAAALIHAAAYNGVRIPLAEHDLLAGWLLDTAGLPVGDARRTLCRLDESGVAAGVPWASAADNVVVVWCAADTYRVADVAAGELSISSGSNIAGEPRDTVRFDTSGLEGTLVPDAVVDQLTLRSALIRGLQVCAALDRILEMSIAHTVERVQFGRSLAKFQAVQNLVADIAAETSLARAAVEAALGEVIRTDWTGGNLEFLVAAARSCAGHAASVVVRNAHQVHGAIGTTREHRLHEFTQAALAWRSEYGSVHHWDTRLAEAAAAAGRDNLWALITK
ncbi:acyl-CoA dehydrogenase family protein [Nocardia sp. 348MFTsu5.1]|uniref:acyl-CoA dehydrogenase family protein n=1 Tax=Nocardia sp. 348MFTsu5.1 TaxID=1172185 RepID=UPI00035E0A59|nr:acyl-CoA dehydrogenase family protein [Nocardia sp. 348MFTsu5.1]